MLRLRQQQMVHLVHAPVDRAPPPLLRQRRDDDNEAQRERCGGQERVHVGAHARDEGVVEGGVGLEAACAWVKGEEGA
eukprot:CAMPEP_0206253732 /NCGR_PEP_ID=MMETSP0047_2-20121206/23310_1 /ASSEMBLY_ACC=CAM_ASM_000192 /TAXON_ID=195065 /ORGANISM="Chroomonas mesostigmatica_cf, Strain CCMP1168" /LENGTH=77 /DNA_ID=CAMNT_0053679963 /DNA_START=122 /DNA_END=355 /DNA_ORIENTATION=-